MISSNETNPPSAMLSIKMALHRYYDVICYLGRVNKRDLVLSVALKSIMKVMNFAVTILPIKIILLLSPSQAITGVIHNWFDSKEQVIYLLSTLVVLILVVSNFFEHKTEIIISRKVKKIVENYGTIKKQRRKIINSIVRDGVSGLSEFLLAACFIAMVSLLYFDLAVVVLICIILVYASMHVVDKTPLYAYIHDHPVKFINHIKDMTLFAAFFYIVFDSIYLESDHNLIVLVIGLMMLRQGAASFSKFCISLVAEYKRRNIPLNNGERAS